MRTQLLLACVAATAALPAQNLWEKKSPTASPYMRRAGAMGFDGTANRMLIHGGTTQTPGSILAETWTYNGTTWTLQASAGGPARWGHQIVRIPATNRLLTFGGRSPTITGFADDTYQWTGSAWTPLLTPTSPPARSRYGLAYDTVRSRAVLFGGHTLAGSVGDTWEFDGVTWSQVATAHTPPPREDMALAFDAALNRTVLFGGYDANTDTLYGDTWEYDGLDWRQVTTTSSPSPRFRMSSIYDTTRKRVLVYGGFDGINVSTATFEYAGGAWNIVTVGAGSPFSTEMYSGYDNQRRKFVTFGGVGAAFNNETWEFTGINSPLIGTFGAACGTSAGLPTAEATTPPSIGQTYTILWSNLPPTAPAVIAFHGLSNQNFQGAPLPIDLGIIDIVGCTLLVSPDWIDVQLAIGGSAPTPFTLPLDNTLLNVVLYSQILVPDPAFTNGVGGVSPGVRAVIGN